VTAAVPTLIAVLAGIALGLAGGGSFDNLLRWRPVAWQLVLGGIAIQLLFRLLPISGTFAVVLDVISMLLMITFVVLNIRVAGMVLILVGLVLNLVPTILNNGMPVSPDALVSAGLVEREDLALVELEGPRHVETDDDSLTFLGEVIAIPTGQVISFGDIVLLFGEMLTISALLRNRRIGASSSRRPAPVSRAARPGPPPRKPPQKTNRKPPRTPPEQANQRPPRSTKPPARTPARKPATAPKPARKPAPAAEQPAPPATPPSSRAPRRRGSADAPRISYEDAVAGMSDPKSTPRPVTRKRARDAGEQDVDLRDESLKRRP
jgi:hypothetical protein